jgi:hypothetical protein
MTVFQVANLVDIALAAVGWRAMAGGQAGAAPADADQSLGRAWQPYRGIYDVPGRLSRSATIALVGSPIGLLMVSVIRLLIVADYNPQTASAIVSSGGYVDTLLGTIIPLVPLFTPYLALLLLFFNRVIPAILTLLAAAFMSPVALTPPAARHLPGGDWYLVTHRNVLILVVMIILAVAFGVVLVLEVMGLGFAVAARTVGTVACIALIPFVLTLYPFPLSNEFYTGLMKQPWLPAEVITPTSGSAFTGYVLSDNGTWLVVLSDGTRTIHYYRSAQIVSQQICQITWHRPDRPLIPLFPAHLNGPTTTPVCSDLLAGQAP